MKSNEYVQGQIFRVTGIDDDFFYADVNHPLAKVNTVIDTVTEDAQATAVGKPDLLMEWAGIDAPLYERDTDFSDADAFDRPDSSNDRVFYGTPRHVLHIDHSCSSRITALYERFLKQEYMILDLMSGWRSHLSESVGQVIGLGINTEEMDDNPQLDSHIVHDLNKNPVLPFSDMSFDAVINTVSIEYLVRPNDVISEVYRILKPGGIFIVTFSNRFFPRKTIALWARLHPVERLGWVLQCLHGGGFRELETHAEYGVKRSFDDRYAGQVEEMDPVFGVWGRR